MAVHLHIPLSSFREFVKVTSIDPHHDHDHDSDGTCRSQTSPIPLSRYEQYGFQFFFPAGWDLTEQTTDDEITITVQSPGTSFWTLAIFPSRPDPEQVLETVVAVIEQDYENVDVVSQIGSLCETPALGHEVDFVCYDLINTASLRAFQTVDETILVLFQGTDHELESTRAQLESISASLKYLGDSDELDDEVD